MQQTQFEKLCSIEHLERSWQEVKAKKAGGGIDGESIASFEIRLRENLISLSEELKTGTWKPFPYMRVEIPKKKNEKRQMVC